LTEVSVSISAILFANTAVNKTVIGGQSGRWLTVEHVGGPLAGPPAAVGAALEQVRRRLGGSASSSRAGSVMGVTSTVVVVVVVVAVGVRVTALDALRCQPGGPRLRRTGARSDAVHSL